MIKEIKEDEWTGYVELDLGDCGFVDGEMWCEFDCVGGGQYRLGSYLVWAQIDSDTKTLTDITHLINDQVAGDLFEQYTIPSIS